MVYISVDSFTESRHSTFCFPVHLISSVVPSSHPSFKETEQIREGYYCCRKMAKTLWDRNAIERFKAMIVPPEGVQLCGCSPVLQLISLTSVRPTVCAAFNIRFYRMVLSNTVGYVYKAESLWISPNEFSQNGQNIWRYSRGKKAIKVYLSCCVNSVSSVIVVWVAGV